MVAHCRTGTKICRLGLGFPLVYCSGVHSEFGTWHLIIRRLTRAPIVEEILRPSLHAHIASSL